MKSLLCKTFTILSIVCLVVACSNQKQTQLLTYINNDLVGLANDDKKLTEDYEKLRANWEQIGDAGMYTELITNIIPACNTLSEKANKLEVVLSEIKDVHETLIKSIDSRCGAFILIADGLSKQDLSVIQKGNEKLAEFARLTRDFNSKLNENAKNNEVMLN